MLLSCLAFYAIFRIPFWSDKMLAGGYLVYTSAIALIYLASLELWLRLKGFRQKNNRTGTD